LIHLFCESLLSCFHWFSVPIVANFDLIPPLRIHLHTGTSLVPSKAKLNPRVDTVELKSNALCSQVSNNPIFSPLEQFTVSTLPIQIASLDLSVTNSAVYCLITFASIYAIWSLLLLKVDWLFQATIKFALKCFIPL
jgi:hypothetical protein